MSRLVRPALIVSFIMFTRFVVMPRL